MALLSILFGGMAISTIHNWHLKGTIVGLEKVTEDQWKTQSMNYSQDKSNFVNKRKYNKQYYIALRNRAYPGEILELDYIYFHGKRGNAATNVKAFGGYPGGLLITDRATGRPWFTMMKKQDGETYKLVLTHIIQHTFSTD